MSTPKKPLGIKGYGHIGHLPGSRVGPGDHTVNPGQAKLCLESCSKEHLITVTEKLDGSNVAVARIGDDICPIIRAGYKAEDSVWEQHRIFDAWAKARKDLFVSLLFDGERVVGEWLAMAHGTRYSLSHDPFVAFDIMSGHQRCTHGEFRERTKGLLVTPRLLHEGGAFSLEQMRAVLEPSGHGALDPVEGAVWRVEKRKKDHGKVTTHFCFMAKWVSPGKSDGCYFGETDIWNWRPE